MPNFDVAELRSKAAWIRDILEPRIAREGYQTLKPDAVLELNALLSKLLESTPSLRIETLRVSRIHRAVALITDKGTRWPAKLIDLSKQIVHAWTRKFGSLSEIRADPYEPGGRLYGIAKANEASRKALERRWLGEPNSLVSPLRALEHGHLEFTPGQWWIHPIFAFHDGIVSSPSSQGGITADSDGAYALMLTRLDQVTASPTADRFTYTTRQDDDPGKFRLMNSILPVKTPVRILRSHTLKSNWSPIVGVRYDGLYKISSWSAKGVQPQATAPVRRESDISQYSRYSQSTTWSFSVTFQREPNQMPIGEVLRHPLAEEVDDYIEYRRVRDLYRRKDSAVGMAQMTLSEEEDIGIDPTGHEDNSDTPQTQIMAYPFPESAAVKWSVTEQPQEHISGGRCVSGQVSPKTRGSESLNQASPKCRPVTRRSGVSGSVRLKLIRAGLKPGLHADLFSGDDIDDDDEIKGFGDEASLAKAKQMLDLTSKSDDAIASTRRDSARRESAVMFLKRRGDLRDYLRK